MNYEGFPGAPIPQNESSDHSDDPFVFPAPPIGTPVTRSEPTSLTPLVCDERAISVLLEKILTNAGISRASAARQLGYKSENAVSQYLNGRRCKIGLMWFLKFCQLCDVKVSIQFPEKRR